MDKAYYETLETESLTLYFWAVANDTLGIHLHITEEKPGCHVSGGIEFHFRTPPEWGKDRAPSFEQCWLLNAPCWHDGSSSQADEDWIPKWERDRDNPDPILNELKERLAYETKRIKGGGE